MTCWCAFWYAIVELLTCVNSEWVALPRDWEVTAPLYYAIVCATNVRYLFIYLFVCTYWVTGLGDNKGDLMLFFVTYFLYE